NCSTLSIDEELTPPDKLLVRYGRSAAISREEKSRASPCNSLHSSGTNSTSSQICSARIRSDASSNDFSGSKMVARTVEEASQVSKSSRKTPSKVMTEVSKLSKKGRRAT
uniref:Uncharacterized protein n=1 Tax=Romanomermis culicivorax TaxID=13658 RepID=A0A915KQA1_ROMCU